MSTGFPSPPFRGEREGPGAKRWEGEVGVGKRSGIPNLTPALSAPEGGEGYPGAPFSQLSWRGAERRSNLAVTNLLRGRLLRFARNDISFVEVRQRCPVRKPGENRRHSGGNYRFPGIGLWIADFPVARTRDVIILPIVR